MIKQQHNQKGLIALILVVMVAAMTLVYGLSVALMTIDEQTTSFGWLHTGKAESYAGACVDNALSLLRNDSNFNGNANLSIGNITCSSTVSGSGNTRAIFSWATATDPFGNNIVERTNINVNINTNPFTITQYKDILD